MLKINPCYRVTIFTKNETITITDPLTCHITVNRGVLSDSQNCTIQITNLAPDTRNKIFKDAFADSMEPENWSFVHVEAGYNGRYSLIFKGRILQAYSSRTGGATDVITEIQAMYLDAIDSMCSYTFKAGTTKLEAFQTIATQIPNVVIGNVGDLSGEFQTDTTFDGSAIDCLTSLTGGAAHVDNGVLNCILNNEVIDVPVPIIGDDTGLLDTPMRRDANLEIKMLFQPDLMVNQLLEIQSSLQPNFNGQFKVVGFTHDLNFGAANSGTRITTANLYIGPLLPGASITNTNGEILNNFNKVKGIQGITPVIGKEPSEARQVYKYIQSHNGKLPNTKITPNITWKNMLGNDNTDSERLNLCTIAICTNAYYTAQAVENMIRLNFKGRKPIINSGWRSPRNNRSCKGAPKSRHLWGLACDFTVSGLSVKQTYPIVKAAWNGYTINEGTWIHVQIEPRKGIVNDK